MFKTEKQTLAERTLWGVSTRTSFDTAMQKIPQLWGRVMSEDLLSQTIHPQPLYAIYTDYESDYRGAYTTILAVEAKVPSSKLQEVTLAEGDYIRFIADGDPKQVVFQLWQYIWQEWELRGHRAYKTDFEVHGVRGPNTADVYVGIRSFYQ